MGHVGMDEALERIIPILVDYLETRDFLALRATCRSFRCAVDDNVTSLEKTFNYPEDFGRMAELTDRLLTKCLRVVYLHNAATDVTVVMDFGAPQKEQNARIPTIRGVKNGSHSIAGRTHQLR